MSVRTRQGLRAARPSWNNEEMRRGHDFSSCQVGDTVAEVNGWRTPSTPVKVIKRTPKFLTLENGDRVRIENGRTEGWSHRRYEPWSDEREAERAAKQREQAACERLYKFPRLCNVLASSDLNREVNESDILREPALTDELEVMLTRHASERHALLDRIFASRS